MAAVDPIRRPVVNRLEPELHRQKGAAIQFVQQAENLRRQQIRPGGDAEAHDIFKGQRLLKKGAQT